jgi:hypothetical protein
VAMLFLFLAKFFLSCSRLAWQMVGCTMNAAEVLSRFSDVCRRKHLSLATEKSYAGWVRSYIREVKELPTAWTSEAKTEAFLTRLAKRGMAADGAVCSTHDSRKPFYADAPPPAHNPLDKHPSPSASHAQTSTHPQNRHRTAQPPAQPAHTTPKSRATQAAKAPPRDDGSKQFTAPPPTPEPSTLAPSAPLRPSRPPSITGLVQP